MRSVKLWVGVAAVSVLFALAVRPVPGLEWLSPSAPAPAAAGPVPAAPPSPAPVMAAAPVAQPPVEAAELSPLEAQMLVQLNAVRGDEGLGLFTLDSDLTAVARLRSQDMLARHYFAHTTPDGGDVYAILDARRVPARFAGENLARNNWDNDQSVARAVAGFMASEPHRLNILNVLFTRVGVGVAVSPADNMKIYAVIFAGDR